MAQFNRPPRLRSPLPEDTIKLPKIPTLSAKSNSSEWLTMVLPLVAVVISAVIMYAISGGSSSWTSYLLFIPIMAFSYLATVLVSGQQKKQHQKKLDQAHARLKTDIYNVEKKLSELSQEEIKKRTRTDPEIAECLSRVVKNDPRLGERRPFDNDYLHVRVGTGDIQASYKIQQEEVEQDTEEFSKEAKALEEIVKRFSKIQSAPFLVDLPLIGSLGISGERPIVRSAIYSMLCQIMTHQWPDEARVTVICQPDAVLEWQFLEKAPHSSYLMTNLNKMLLEKDQRKALAALMKGLELELQQREQTFEAKKLLKRDDEKSSQMITPMPRLIIIFDEGEGIQNHPAVSLLLEKGKDLGVYGIFLTDHPSRVPGGCQAVISLQGGKLHYKQSGIKTIECQADLIARSTAENFVAAISAIPYPAGGATSQPPEQVTFLQLFNVKRVEDLPVDLCWSGKSPFGYLRTPIGKTSPTSDWIFDLNDRDGAHGPHGLLGGMTGSGKSETLKAIILSLAVTHHPYDLNFALVDFKGGAAFNELRNLPHTVGVVTDIESNPTFAERVIQSLTGEIERRKKVLENARGTFRFGRSHIDEYREKLRTRRPLPRLLIVFDEFAEFKTRNPADSRKLIGIARQGRSLGVHLLLATQNISAAIDPEIMQNSTYRICLKVSDPQDSIQMVGIPDAISLKRGRAYFSVTSRVLYQSAFSGADYIPDEFGASVPNSIIRIHPNGKRDEVSMLAWSKPEKNTPTHQPATEAAAVVDYLANKAQQMGLLNPDSVWQEALPDRVYLPALLDQNILGGWDGKSWQPCRLLTNRENIITTVFPYLGYYDNPQDQSQPGFQIDPAQGGNILIFGSAGSGKSTLLRTLVTSLALTHTPEQVHVYVLDYGGQSRLKILEAFPHVGAVITRMESERTERLVSYLSTEIVRRNGLMRKAGVDSWVDYNLQPNPDEIMPAIFVVIDGFLNFKDAFEPEMIKKVVMLISGQSAGIQLAISAYTQSDLPNEIITNINNRISFYQATPGEYHGLVGFLSDARVQEDAVLGMRPGRGLLRSTAPLAFQAALPTSGESDKDQTVNLSALATSMRNVWGDKQPIPPKIQALEEFIYLPPKEQIQNKADYYAEIGVTYKELKPIGFSLGQDGNTFLVSSTSPGAGKTTFLQMWLLRLMESNTPKQLQINIIGYHDQSLSIIKSQPHVKYIKLRSVFQDFLNEILKNIEIRTKDQEDQIHSNLDNFDQAKFLDQYSHIIIVIDEYSKFSASLSDNERAQLMDIIQKGDEMGISIVISDTMADLPKPYNDILMTKFSTSGCGVLLGGSDGIDFYNNAQVLQNRPNVGLSTGRGYFIRRGKVNLFQAGVWWQQNDNSVTALENRLANISSKSRKK